MAANGVKDADMSDCDGQKVVTMMDVLQEQQDFEEDANAVLGASDDKNCTYSKGYVKRQAIYACLTCCPEARNVASKRAGVCLACSLHCHENHELVELYTKRNFRCDCGNPKFGPQTCTFTPNKTDINYDNRYNQNFSGVYCICHRPYPDPEATEEEEMIQCVICEDWLHENHLEATVPQNDQYGEMVCKACMEDNDFLHDYSDLVINVVDKEIIVTDPDLDVIIQEKQINGHVEKDEQKDSEEKHEKPVESENMEEKLNEKEQDSGPKANDSENKPDCDSKVDNAVTSENHVVGTEKVDETASKAVDGDEKATDIKEGNQTEVAVGESGSETEVKENAGAEDIKEADGKDATKENVEGDSEIKKPETEGESENKEPENNEQESEVKEPENVASKDTETKESEEEKSLEVEMTDETLDRNGEVKETVDIKRKHSESEDDSSAKKAKLDNKPCIRPRRVKRVYRGATFWPSNLRQKLCTCGECISMYKDLGVLFLIDLEDTVTAYEALGKENAEGPSSQYEKGLQALSSLDRVQQINALTEYNKMKDKLLDFLKTFKDRKEIVKEEDIKAFFAGMKPKREPDGVYFCR